MQTDNAGAPAGAPATEHAAAPVVARDCKHEAGVFRPVIDRNRCEGKEDCVRVCPYQVFEIGLIGVAEKASMSPIGRVKAFFHGGRQAFAVRGDACHGCGLCVVRCPERAITLRRS